MAYDAPRPYRPHLASPTSYDSLRPPPSVTTWSDPSSHTASPSPSTSSIAVAQQHPAGAFGAGPQTGGPTAPPVHPNVLVRKGDQGGLVKHEVVNMGGTGVIKAKEEPGRRRKRILLMLICGSVICGIIVLVVLGVKGQL